MTPGHLAHPQRPRHSSSGDPSLKTAYGIFPALRRWSGVAARVILRANTISTVQEINLNATVTSLFQVSRLSSFLKTLVGDVR